MRPLGPALISFVIPALNEADSLPELYAQLSAVLESLTDRCEIVFVNDGSVDASLEIMQSLRVRDPRVGIVSLSRRFGHQAAITAGLEHASGDAVIIMDADLQDEPSAVVRFIEKWREGYDVVFARRIGRKELWPKRKAFSLFYYLLNKAAAVDIPRDAGVFGLMDRKVLRHVVALQERNRYLPGLRAWFGFKQTGVVVARNPRFKGQPRVSFLGLVSLAVDGLVSFSVLPLRLATFAGLITACVSLLLAVGLVIVRLTSSLQIPGIISILAAILFLGGLQIFFLGIVGEYVGRIYDEAKRRPLYVVDFVEGVEQHRQTLPP